MCLCVCVRARELASVFFLSFYLSGHSFNSHPHFHSYPLTILRAPAAAAAYTIVWPTLAGT